MIFLPMLRGFENGPANRFIKYLNRPECQTNFWLHWKYRCIMMLLLILHLCIIMLPLLLYACGRATNRAHKNYNWPSGQRRWRFVFKATRPLKIRTLRRRWRRVLIGLARASTQIIRVRGGRYPRGAVIYVYIIYNIQIYIYVYNIYNI